MPLDRRIKIRLQAEGAYVAGRYQAGAVTVHRVWAELRDVDATDVEAAEGNRDRREVEWIVRYRRDVATTPNSRLVIVSDRGFLGNVERVAELAKTRRRFLSIRALMTEDTEVS